MISKSKESTLYHHSVKPATRPTSASRLVVPASRIAPLDGVAVSAPVEVAVSDADAPPPVTEAEGPAEPEGEAPVALA